MEFLARAHPAGPQAQTSGLEKINKRKKEIEKKIVAGSISNTAFRSRVGVAPEIPHASRIILCICHLNGKHSERGQWGRVTFREQWILNFCKF